MADPSDYELSAWRDIQRFKSRPLSRAMRNAGEQVAIGTAEIGKRATTYLDKHPRAQSAVSRGQKVAAKGGDAVGVGVGKAADVLPDWSDNAYKSMRRTVGRVSRAGLSSTTVVEKHKKRSHDVVSLSGLRRLDLEQIDAVRGRGTSWYYPAAAALSGAGAGLVITGGELAATASAGAAAAPSLGAIAGAFAGDAAVVLGLASRSVGHISLLYGYDPEEPTEKLFVLSVVNAGTAMSASAKTAAMADISRLTQALVRGKTWAVLNESVLARLSRSSRRSLAFGLPSKGSARPYLHSGSSLAAPSTGQLWRRSLTPPTLRTEGGSSSRSTHNSVTRKHPNSLRMSTRTFRTTATRRSACSANSRRQADPTSTDPGSSLTALRCWPRSSERWLSVGSFCWPAAVSTVDKFQGQEAAVVLYSMTASSSELVPRGNDFLFSKNRLNVAISRARCLAYLICNDDLLDTRARKVDDMKLSVDIVDTYDLAMAQENSTFPKE